MGSLLLAMAPAVGLSACDDDDAQRPAMAVPDAGGPGASEPAPGNDRVDAAVDDRDGGAADADYCAESDARGVFAACPACPSGSCVPFSQQGVSYNACMCMQDADCPCGTRCGCLELAPSVPLCAVCVVP